MDWVAYEWLIALIGGALIGLAIIYSMWKDRQPKRTCWVRCPTCEHDLNGDNDSFVDDHEIFGVTYSCAKCGTKSRWNFDAPVPLLLQYETEKPE